MHQPSTDGGQTELAVANKGRGIQLLTVLSEPDYTRWAVWFKVMFLIEYAHCMHTVSYSVCSV